MKNPFWEGVREYQRAKKKFWEGVKVKKKFWKGVREWKQIKRSSRESVREYQEIKRKAFCEVIWVRICEKEDCEIYDSPLPCSENFPDDCLYKHRFEEVKEVF